MTTKWFTSVTLQVLEPRISPFSSYRSNKAFGYTSRKTTITDVSQSAKQLPDLG